MNGLKFNPLSANFAKWSNTLKQFVGSLPTNYLSVFDHFVQLALKGLNLCFEPFQDMSGIQVNSLSWLLRNSGFWFLL